MLVTGVTLMLGRLALHVGHMLMALMSMIFVMLGLLQLFENILRSCRPCMREQQCKERSAPQATQRNTHKHLKPLTNEDWAAFGGSEAVRIVRVLWVCRVRRELSAKS